MRIIRLPDIALHYREDGDPAGPALVFSNSLGTDLRLWDKVVPLLPGGLRVIRYDQRGHGLSDAPAGRYSMGTMVTDAERLLENLGVRECVFVGISMGGMIAQGLAVKRPDMLRALVLCDTGAKIGTAEMWQARIEGVLTKGMAAVADGILDRWFAPAFRATPEFAAWRNMLMHQPPQGYAGACAAISGTDFYTPTSGLTLPTLAIAGAEDSSTPADLVRETASLIHGSRFELIRGAGHLPCVEKPDAYAALLTAFLKEAGHV